MKISFFLIFLLSTAITLSAQWVEVADNDELKMYCMNDVMKVQDNKVLVVVQKVYKGKYFKDEIEFLKSLYPKSAKEFNEYSYTLEKMVIDCEKNAWRTIAKYYYDSNNNKLGQTVSEKNTFYYIPPNSMIEGLAQYVCREKGLPK